MTKFQKKKTYSSSKKAKRFFLVFCLFLFGVTVFMSFVPQAKAFFGSSDDEKQEYAQMARDRSYPGGADEDDLRVLPKLPSQKNKKPGQENSEGF